MNNDCRIDSANFWKQEQAKHQGGMAGMAQVPYAQPGTRKGQITEQVESLENALVAQYGIIELLAEKMRPFLGNDNTCQTQQPAHQETPSCPMANVLRTVFERLDSHNTLLNHLIESIEI